MLFMEREGENKQEEAEIRAGGNASKAGGARFDSESSTASPRERLWSSVFMFVVAATLCTFMVGQGLNSGTGVYVGLYGGTATYAGVLAAVFSVAAAVTRLVSGPIIDARGRRVVMVVGGVVMLAGTLGPLFTHETAPFIAFRLLQGAGFSALTTASATAAADVLPASRLGEGIGYYGLGQALAMSIGPALALFLVSTEPAENLFIGTSAAAAVAVLFAVLCRYERSPENLPATSAYRRRAEEARAQGKTVAELAKAQMTGGDSGAACAPGDGTASSPSVASCIFSSFFERRALPGALPALVISPVFGFGIFFVGMYGTSLGIGSSGLFFSVAAVSMIAVRLKSAAFMDRVAPIKILGAGVACGIVAYLLLLACGTAFGDFPGRDILFYVCGIPYGICLGVSQPVNQSVAVKNTPPERWGAANALFQFAIDVGIGVACVVWGVVNDGFGFPVTICGVLACLVAAFLVAKAVYPKK